MSVRLDLAGDESPEKVELLYRGADRPLLARFREDSGRPYTYVSTDRLIVGLERDPAAWMEPEALTRDLAELLELEGETERVSVTPLGGRAALVSLDGNVVSLKSDDSEREAAEKAPGLALLSQLRRSGKRDEVGRAGSGALRYAVPDRLITLAPLVESDKPVAPRFRDRLLMFLGLRSSPTRWGLLHIGATAVHAGGNGGSGSVKVALIDSGLFKHEDFKRILWSEAVDVSDPENVVYADARSAPCDVACDGFGHGTKVAGLIASKDFGVAPETSVIPIRVFDDRGCGWSSALSLGIDQARKKGADVIAAAWVLQFEDQALLESIDRVQDTLFVTPTDDAGVNLDQSPLYPAGWRRQNLLVVGGIDDKDRWASNFGPATVDIPAPSVAIKTVTRTGGAHFFDGSSLAVGYAAGAAALYLANRPNAAVDEIHAALTTRVRLRGRFPNCCQDCGALDIGLALLGQPTSVPGTTPTGCQAP